MENHNCSWENPRFQCLFSIVMLNQRVTGHSTKAYFLWPFYDIFCDILESHLIIHKIVDISQNKKLVTPGWRKISTLYTEHFPMSNVPMPEMPHVFSESSRRWLPLPVRCCGRIRSQWPRWGARQRGSCGTCLPIHLRISSPKIGKW